MLFQDCDRGERFHGGDIAGASHNHIGFLAIVGLIYIALATATNTELKELNLTGDRERIRFWATQHALELIRRSLL